MENLPPIVLGTSLFVAMFVYKPLADHLRAMSVVRFIGTALGLMIAGFALGLGFVMWLDNLWGITAAVPPFMLALARWRSEPRQLHPSTRKRVTDGDLDDR
jgi:uncharacterized membrane protein YccC